MWHIYNIPCEWPLSICSPSTTCCTTGVGVAIVCPQFTVITSSSSNGARYSCRCAMVLPSCRLRIASPDDTRGSFAVSLTDAGLAQRLHTKDCSNNALQLFIADPSEELVAIRSDSAKIPTRGRAYSCTCSWCLEGLGESLQCTAASAASGAPNCVPGTDRTMSADVSTSHSTWKSGKH